MPRHLWINFTNRGVQIQRWVKLAAVSAFFVCLYGCKYAELDQPHEISDRSARSGDESVSHCKDVDIDWYTVACANNSCYWSFNYTETRTVCYYTGSRGGGGGGGTYFLDDTPVYANADWFLNNITRSSTLSSLQRSALKLALEDFRSPCLQSNVYDQLATKGIKFGFGINSGISGEAIFNPNDGSLLFKSGSSINQENLREELFHGYQNSFIDGGAAQYTNSGRPNIEFEAKFFKDLVNIVDGGSGGQVYGVPTNSPKVDDYNRWLIEITSNYTKYPTSINIDKYFEYMREFKAYNPSMSNYNIDLNLLPDALMNLINGSKCSK